MIQIIVKELSEWYNHTPEELTHILNGMVLELTQEVGHHADVIGVSFLHRFNVSFVLFTVQLVPYMSAGVRSEVGKERPKPSWVAGQETGTGYVPTFVDEETGEELPNDPDLRPTFD